MLARANVPTVEAGTFPSHKPQAPPQRSAPSFVVPDDSASQIGPDENAARNGHPKGAISSISHCRPTQPAIPQMAPPHLFPTSFHPTEAARTVLPLEHVALQTSDPPRARPAYPKSNISLSTATTLVPGKQDHNRDTAQSHRRAVEQYFAPIHDAPNEFQSRRDLEATDLANVPVRLRPNANILPPSRQEVQFRQSDQEQIEQRPRTRATSKAATDTLQSQTMSQVDEAAVGEPVLLTKPNAKGKGKRAAASNIKKAPAAKKPRANASTTKRGGKAEKKSEMPEVEELLQRPAIEIPISERGGDLPDDLSPELGQLPTGQQTRAASQALNSVPPNTLNMKQANTHDPRTTYPPCTPADQIISNPLTPASLGGQVRESDFDATRPDLAHHDTISHPGAPKLPRTHPSFSLAQKCMTVDENFDLANANTRLEKWHSLPSEARTKAMESYFCELIMDDKFVALTKDVSLFWEGAILEGRVNRMTMRGAAGTLGEEEEEEEL